MGVQISPWAQNYMITNKDILIQIIISILGLSGFLIARHIWNHKTKHTPLICPGRFDCHAVVHSSYAQLFGIPNEFLGMIYYAFISFSFLFFLILTLNAVPLTKVVVLFYFIFFGSLMSVLFSIYLLWVQIFILKKGCSWCIISAVISAIIFILLFI